MTIHWVVLAVVGVFANHGAQERALDRAGWLTGCWELRAGTRVITEMWMAPSGGMMLSASRTVVNGVTREFEFARITARGDTLVYTAVPSGQAQTDFRAATFSGTTLIFENRAHDFPQVITYRPAGADSLVARIEGPGANSVTRMIDYPMRRVSCTAAGAS